MIQTKTITISSAAAMRLLQDIAALHLIDFVDETDKTDGEYRQTPAIQAELTNQVNAVYAKIAEKDAEETRQVTAMAAATVWETLKNDSW
jgi:hypothetical protein